MATSSPAVDDVVRDFTARLVELVNAQAIERVLAAVASALAVPPSRDLATTRKNGSDGDAVRKARRKLRLSAKTLAIRRLQGQYLGVLRRLAPAARERVKRIAKEKGVAAAVTFGKSLK